MGWFGTSGATPIVAGIVALVRAAYPNLDAANVINRVLVTATPVTDKNPDPLYGYGIVNAQRALTAEVPLVSANPLGSIDDWVVLHRRQEGEAVVVPLGPATIADGSTSRPERAVPLEPDTQLQAVPYLITLGFGVVFLVVLTTGAIVVIGRLRNR